MTFALTFCNSIFRVKDGKDHAKEPDLGNVADIEDEFFVPHFQRISATGDDITGVKTIVRK